MELYVFLRDMALEETSKERTTYIYWYLSFKLIANRFSSHIGGSE